VPSKYRRENTQTRRGAVNAMYLKLKKATYEKLLDRSNNAGMALASYINQILEQNTIQQGREIHERMDSVEGTNCNRVD